MDLTREQLFHSLDLQARIAVDIPELGGTIYIKRMSGAEGFAYSQHSTQEGLSDDEQRALLLIYTICDSHGVCLFAQEDVAAVLTLPFALVLPLIIQASNLNGLDVSLVDLKKNSLTSRNGSPGIVSLAPSA